MSISWMNAAWATEVGSPTRKAVLIVLADHADEDGYCWPRVSTICDKSELSERAVRDAIKVLEVDGFVSVQEHYEPAGRQTSNVYKLEMLEIPQVSPTRGRGAGGAGGRVQEVQGVGAGGAPSTGTTNEPAEGTTNVRRRGATPQKPKSRRQVLPDETPDDDAPALGASPRKSTADVKKSAASRGTSGYGLALRLQRGLERQEAVTATVDVGALAKRLNDLHKRGQSREVQAKMVELFVANPKRYTRGAADKGWLAFLQAVPMLQDDSEKHTRAEAGGTGQTVTLDVDDPYEGAR